MCEENYSDGMKFMQYNSNEPCEIICMPNEQCQSVQVNYGECDVSEPNRFLPPCCDQCSVECPPENFYGDCGTQQQNEDCFDSCALENSSDNQNCCPCPEDCQVPACSQFTRRRYVQPPRRPSFKPVINYQRPIIPMSNETIYKKSFECVDSNTARCCRMPPAKPITQLCAPCGPFEKETVTKLSFQPYCGVERVKPIYPRSPSLLGKGPMQGLTTQKHDFVPKFQYRRLKCVPKDNMPKSCGCIEKCTVQKLSFSPPCVSTRTESFKPIVNYKRPELPMEFETTQKLSYMPVCPPKKEFLPWAEKAKYLRPSIPFARDTVTKLSFQAPGCFIEDCCAEPCNEPVCCEMPRAAC